MLRGQASGEYLLALSVLLSILVGVVLPVLGDAEVSSALAAARVGAQSFVVRNASMRLTSIDYLDLSANYTFTPSVYLNGSSYSGDTALRQSMLSAVAGVFNPSLSVDVSTECVQAVYHKYCVSVG